MLFQCFQIEHKAHVLFLFNKLKRVSDQRVVQDNNINRVQVIQ